MSRQQKRLIPKASPDCPNIAGPFQFPNSSFAHHCHVQNKPSQQILRTKRKHVLKACERCRVKKSKCDGNQPCGRCLAYNQGCIFRDRKATQEKVYSRGFVEMLISQHAVHLQALQDLYRRCVSREGLPGSSLDDPVHGRPGTHAILSRLGLIKQAEEMADDPQAVIDDIVDYIKSLESSSSDNSSHDSAESTELSQSGGPSPEPSTPRELASASSEPSIADKWSVAAENSHQYQGCDVYEPVAPRYHSHHCHHQQQIAGLPLSTNSFPYQNNTGHLNIPECTNIQHQQHQQGYDLITPSCHETELSNETMWSLSSSCQDMPGLLPYGERDHHLMAMDQDGYSGVSQFGNEHYSTFLQR